MLWNKKKNSAAREEAESVAFKECQRFQEEETRNRVRDSALESWTATASGVSLAENPIPDIMSKCSEHFDTIATVAQIAREGEFPIGLHAKVVHGAVEGQLAAIAQLRAALSPLENRLRELQDDYQAIQDGKYINWLTQEDADLLDYDPEKAERLMRNRSPHSREDELR